MSDNVLDWTSAYPKGVFPSAGQARLGAFVEKLATDLSGPEGGRLPFVNMPHWPSLKRDLEILKPRLKGFKHMLLLGIGGSALGPRALQKAFFPQQDQPGHTGPWLWIADNVDVPTLAAYFTKLPPKDTVVVAVSKSGGTIETTSQYFLACQWLKDSLGQDWKDHLVMVTGGEGFFHKESQKHGFTTLPVPTYMGGRYSVLSAVGLVPATFLGIDCDALVEGALSVSRPLFDTILSPKMLAAHPAWQLATWNWSIMDSGFTQLIFFCYVPKLATLGAWFGQLWAESLGKQGKGSMPLPAVGVTDQHSLQQMFLDGPRDKGCLFLTSDEAHPGLAFPDDIPAEFGFLRGKAMGDLLPAEALGSRMAMTQRGIPLVEARLGTCGEHECGRLMALLELSTLFTGWLMSIDPLDQPAVELGKRLAKARLGADGLVKEKAELAEFLAAQHQTTEF
ncbi:glucose-6-phosphate isomerase [Fundidesulfovibrio terrae]|uniref:glucose-6-phosphate isomerase n=1 Tax=Fundidesulfovibrio terrae TaxID=2922866 RepID=UPI001FAFA260|nr:glucose-6-phosphate isomerase [Fundidesulfovibrio terrae]